MPPPEVSFVITEAKSIPINYEYLGVLEPFRVMEIRARVQGFLAQRLFVEGAAVTEGDVLYTIERDQFETDVEVAQARVEQSAARLKLAGQDLARLEAASGDGAVSAGTLDTAKSELSSAKASLRLAKANQAKAELELSYTEIRAPLSGTIGKSGKEVGSLVDDGTNSLLTSITKVDPIFVTFGVSEREYSHWREDVESGRVKQKNGGEPKFEIVRQDGAVYGETGTLNFLPPSFSTQTGTLQARAEFPNKEGKLRPGQFVKVRTLGWERPDTILIPQRSVNQSPTGAFVFVIGEGNMTEFRPVTLGIWSGNDWIITTGLKSGERVMVDGLMKMQPGAPVNPVPFVKPVDALAMPPAAPAAAK